ncbi:MAG: hypothetical protein DRJ57_04960 [Thermoprotei archaeon]|nr:MAG: hypothetical protein DRJ57_04960 [Thermoprotei archaeon]
MRVDLYIAYRIMKVLEERKLATIRQIQRESRVSQGAVVKYVNILEKRGYVKSIRLGKYRYVSLTEKGEKVLEQLSQIITQFSVP